MECCVLDSGLAVTVTSQQLLLLAQDLPEVSSATSLVWTALCQTVARGESSFAFTWVWSFLRQDLSVYP